VPPLCVPPLGGTTSFPVYTSVYTSDICTHRGGTTSYIYIYVYIYTYIYIYIRCIHETYTSDIRTHIHMWFYMRISHVCVCVRISDVYVWYTHTYVCVYQMIYAHIDIYIRVYHLIYAHICISVCVYHICISCVHTSDVYIWYTHTYSYVILYAYIWCMCLWCICLVYTSDIRRHIHRHIHHTYVCVYQMIYAYIYVYVCVYHLIYAHICVISDIYQMYTSMCMSMYMSSVYICTFIWCVCIHLYVYIYTSTYQSMHMSSVYIWYTHTYSYVILYAYISCMCLCAYFRCICLVYTFFDGYCSTVQDLLDWFEVDLGFAELSFIQIDLCVLCLVYTSDIRTHIHIHMWLYMYI